MTYKTMLKPVFFLALTWQIGQAHGQVLPEIQWQRSWGSSGNDDAKAIKQTTDGGYIVVGRARGNDGDITGFHGGDGDVWVIKLDATGTVLWQKVLGGSGADHANDVAPTNDGGYIVAADTYSTDGDVVGNHGGWDAWIIKLDTDGEIQWQQCYGGTGTDGASSVVVTAAGGYAIAGTTHSSNGDVTGNHGSGDYWLVRIDSIGTLLWQVCSGGTWLEECSAMTLTSDGGYIMIGSSSSVDGDITDPQGGTDIWVVKRGAAGGLEWQHSLGSSSEDIGYAVCSAMDNGYYISGVASQDGGLFSCNHGGFDGYLAKLDLAGGLDWQQVCYGGSTSDFLLSIVPVADGGCTVSGWTGSSDGDINFNQGGNDGWLTRFGPTGVRLWQGSLGGTDNDGLYTIIPTDDGGYAVAGNSSSTDGDVTENQGGSDLWVVKLAPDGVDIDEQAAQSPFILFPNPTQDWLYLRLDPNTPATAHIDLFALDGRHLATLADGTDRPSTVQELSTAHLPAGMYSVRLTTPDRSWTQRFVKM